jgi:lipid-binding SYLF domain-containing protein
MNLDTDKMLTTGVHSFEREWSEENDENVIVPGLKNLGFVGTGEYGTELLKKISNNGQEVDVSVILMQGGGTISLGIDHKIRSVLSPEMNAELNQALAETWQFLSDNGASNLEMVECDDSNTP